MHSDDLLYSRHKILAQPNLAQFLLSRNIEITSNHQRRSFVRYKYLQFILQLSYNTSGSQMRQALQNFIIYFSKVKPQVMLIVLTLLTLSID